MSRLHLAAAALLACSVPAFAGNLTATIQVTSGASSLNGKTITLAQIPTNQTAWEGSANLGLAMPVGMSVSKAESRSFLKVVIMNIGGNPIPVWTFPYYQAYTLTSGRNANSTLTPFQSEPVPNTDPAIVAIFQNVQIAGESAVFRVIVTP